MKHLLLIFLFIFSLSCGEVSQDESSTISDNNELQELYNADQGDRTAGTIDWSVVSVRDEERQARVIELLDSGKVRTSADYANAAMIFQHGGDTVASGMAVSLMQKAIELDTTMNKWLLAAAIDRDLMRRNIPQIYGTQYVKSGLDESWRRYDIDTTQVTDEERRDYGVETLAEQETKVLMMNKKSLQSYFADGNSVEDLIVYADEIDVMKAEYNLSESTLNRLGYTLLSGGKADDALKIFKLNTELYPEGFNTWDSYGECLLKLGFEEEGINAYKKSLELNPNNENASEVLEGLQKN